MAITAVGGADTVMPAGGVASVGIASSVLGSTRGLIAGTAGITVGCIAAITVATDIISGQVP
jgi:hypothetical protein